MPIAILASLLICAAIYFVFSLALCGVVPFREINEEAPVADAFGPRHADVPWVGIVIDWGAALGVLTSLLTGLYSQARMYLAIARDGLFFKAFKRVSLRFGTPGPAQMLCGTLAAVLAVCFPLEKLARLLNIGVLSSYSVVCSGVLVLRAEDPQRVALASLVVTVLAVLFLGPGVQWLATAIGASAGGVFAVYLVLGCIVVAAWLPVIRCRYVRPPEGTFACPLCPYVPLIGLTVNGYLLSQCHWEAWVRLAAITGLVLIGYAVRVRRSLTNSRQAAAPLEVALSQSFQPDGSPSRPAGESQ